MTIVAVALLGVGVVLIASALDNTPIVATFQKIISGQHIDWTGGGATGTASVPSGPNNATQPTAPKQPNGSCPPGYILINGICQSTAGI